MRPIQKRVSLIQEPIQVTAKRITSVSKKGVIRVAQKGRTVPTSNSRLLAMINATRFANLTTTVHLAIPAKKRKSGTAITGKNTKFVYKTNLKF
jgi:hypothetical protein